MPLQSSSSFRGYGYRDNRRRRLLTDELANAGSQSARAAWPEADSPSVKSEHYGEAAFLEQQLRLLDLVPRGLVAVTFLPAVVTGILVGLEASYAWMVERVANGGARLAALDLAAKGSLGCWLSTLLLLAASLASLLVYAVRRHRTDDYQGRYRIWLWAAACWFVLASDQAASLREGFRDLMIALTGTRLVGDGTLWWAALYVLLLGAVGSRLLMDMRPCKISIGALLAAGSIYAIAAAGRLGWIFTKIGNREVMFLAGAEILGSLMLLVAMLWHARHVLDDAEGLLPHSESQEEEALAEHEPIGRLLETSASDGDRWRKIDPPHAASQPAFQRAAAAATPSPTSASGLSPISRKLTKQERKALKEQLLRERLERQRRGL